MSLSSLAALCARAYGETPTVGQTDSASVMHVFGTIHCFRSTANLEGWLHDLDILTTRIDGLGELHQGFWDATARILPACLALPPPTQIIGHSLGGAMAIIYAGVYNMLGHVIPIAAFEPPRPCGDATLQLRFMKAAQPWFASRNGNDIVTQVPPGLTLPGGLTRIGHALLPFDNVSDHSIERVIAALQEAGL